MNKQIEEIAENIADSRARNCDYFGNTTSYTIEKMAENLYNAGYRKQIEGEWVDNHCTACGMSPIGDEAWTNIGLTPPRFDFFMSYCPSCGAKMKGGAE